MLVVVVKYHQQKFDGLTRLMVKKLLIRTVHSPLYFFVTKIAASNANCLILTILQQNRRLRTVYS